VPKLRSQWSEKQRKTRRHSIAKDDQRDRFERDRDRILYSSAFRRLAGITQVVRAGEADVFHTRQQHTIKVAQVGRRLAQN
jgi:dGTPase